MKKTLLIAALLLLPLPAVLAITPSEWRFRQSVEVEKTGPMRILLPLETLDRLAPDLRDLRLVDASGRELSYAIVEDSWVAGAIDGEWRALRLPVEMRLDDARRETVVTIVTGTDALVGSVRLLIPDTTEYTVAARLEISDDGRKWESLGDGWPLYRRNRADGSATFTGDSLTLKKERKAPFIRVTMPTGTAPIAVTGASVVYWTGREMPPQPNIKTVPAAITGIVEKPGETVVRLDLGAANLKVSHVTLDVEDVLFRRHVAFAYERDGVEHSCSSTIYRFPIAEGKSAEGTNVSLCNERIPSREIELRIKNKDSGPLGVRGAAVSWWPNHLVFSAPEPGRYDLLSGNPAAAQPDYDLNVILEKMEPLEVAEVNVGLLVETPDYRAPEPAREPGQFANNALFWLALAVVVIVLLVVVAKLLPKPRGDS